MGRNKENGKKYRKWEEIQRTGRNTENRKQSVRCRAMKDLFDTTLKEIYNEI